MLRDSRLQEQIGAVDTAADREKVCCVSHSFCWDLTMPWPGCASTTPTDSVCYVHNKDACYCPATPILDDFARCLLADAGSATSLSSSRVQSVCRQGRSKQDAFQMAMSPLYQFIRVVFAVAGTWVHCSSLALRSTTSQIFTLMQFHAIHNSSSCDTNTLVPVY